MFERKLEKDLKRAKEEASEETSEFFFPPKIPQFENRVKELVFKQKNAVINHFFFLGSPVEVLNIGV